MGKNSNSKPRQTSGDKAAKKILLSIKMNTVTPTTLDAPSTDVAAVAKVSASEATLPSGPVVKTVEEVKAENKAGLIATQYQDPVTPAKGQPAGKVKKPETKQEQADQ